MISPCPTRVLIVEDSDIYRALLRRFLGMAYPDMAIEEHDPIKHGLPEGGFDWSTYDLILLDYQLGGSETGLDWLRRFRNDPDLPAVIVLTAEGDEEVAVQALKSGADDYLRKQTLTGKRLYQSIRQAIAEHGMRRRASTDLASLRHTLFNRSAFLEAISEAAAEQPPGAKALVTLIELDAFAEMRRDYGLALIDAFSRHLSEQIMGLLAEMGHEYRLMRVGDATLAAAIADYQAGDNGEQFASGLCAHLEGHPYRFAGSLIPSTVSVGVATIEGNRVASEQAFARADLACREAAKHRGNTFSILTTPIGSKEMESDGVKDLARAFSENRFQGYFQALMGTSEKALQNAVRYFQMRVRMVTEEGAIVAPKDFIPRIEASGLLPTLDRWVIRHGIGRLMSLQEGHAGPIGLFLRVTGASLPVPSFAKWLDQLLAHVNNADITRFLILELEPQDILDSTEETKAFVTVMRERHRFRFALVNVPNESVLKRCFEHVRFDFVKGAVLAGSESSDNSRDLARLAAMLATAKSFGAITTADRIECAVVLSWAIRNQIDYVQGNFVAGPVNYILERDIAHNVEIA